MGIALGIVAHQARQVDASCLADTVNAAVVSVDTGRLGCDNNHKAVYRQLMGCGTEWVCVLEDDVIPVINFGGQLAKIAASAPTPIVSLYLGRQRPPQYQARIADAIAKAHAHDAHYIVTDRLLSAQGVLMATRLVPDMLDKLRWLPIDEGISRWAQRAGHRIAYSVPSVIEHRDGPTLVRHRDGKPRPPGRTAWTVGTRSVWTPDSVDW